MRIFGGGISTETNTFSPMLTGLSDFLVQRGRDAAVGHIEHPSLNLDAVWGDQAREFGDTFCFGLMAWAPPSGITLSNAYECLREELLGELRAFMPVDAVLLNLHGAMVSQGYEDCEEDIIRRVREQVGPSVIIGVELDLHCHLTEAKIACADIVLTYKEYPHVDMSERARALFDLARKAREGRIQPTMALYDCRMVGLFPTSAEPLRSLVDDMISAEARGEALCISFGHGFQFADLPHVGAKVLVVADGDADAAQRVATTFGERIVALRKQIGFDSRSLPLEEALARSMASATRPVIVADQSDNTGSGAPGDSTFALDWMIRHGAEHVGIAIIHDPEVVRAVKKAGIGSKLPIRLGGKTGPTSGNPLDLEVEVVGIQEAYMHELPQMSGDPWLFPSGDTVALRVGRISLIVGSVRCQCFSPKIFSDCGVDVSGIQIFVVKSSQHFYSGFSAIAGEIIYMTGPGAVPPDPRKIQYTRLDTTKMYPWVDEPFAASRNEWAEALK